MLRDVVPYLACPHCGGVLAAAGRSLRCDHGHAFDVAKQGYVNLLPGNAQAGTADTAPMVAARDEFLAAGHYAPVAQVVAAHAARVAPDGPACVLDVGAGAAYYLRHVLERLPLAAGVALDLSKHAARRAARADRVGAVVSDAWQRLPLRDAAAAVALSVFAPRNAAELWRVLRPRGTLLVVTPTPQHLAELVAPLGLLHVDQDKSQRLATQLGQHFTLAEQDAVTTQLRLTADDAQRVVMMGPNAWHTDAAAVRDRVAALPSPLAATLSVTLGVYRRADAGDLARSAP